MGVGWPLKVILGYIFYLPYYLIIFLISHFYNLLKQKTKLYN